MNKKLPVVLILIIKICLLLPISKLSANQTNHCPPNQPECQSDEPNTWWSPFAGSSADRYSSPAAIAAAITAENQAGYNTCLLTSHPQHCQLNIVTSTGNPLSPLSEIINGNDTIIEFHLEWSIQQTDINGAISHTASGSSGGGAAQLYHQCPPGKSQLVKELSPNNYAFVCNTYFEFQVVGSLQPQQCEDSKDDTEGNPCNPATGSKTQAEIDYAPSNLGGISLTRFYDSQLHHDIKADTGVNWRTNYSVVLNDKPVDLMDSRNLSPKYLTSDAACEHGFNTLKNKIWGGQLNSTLRNFSSTKLSQSKCRITDSSNRELDVFEIVKFPINTSFVDTDSIDNYRTITYGDGRVSIFKPSSFTGSWKNQYNTEVSYLTESGSELIHTAADNSKEVFNSSGQLIRIIDISGRETTLNHNLSLAQNGDDNPDTLDVVTDSYGRSIKFNYSIDNNLEPIISSVVTPDGIINYNFDNNDNLSNVVYTDGSIKTYHYEKATHPNHLTGITDENNTRFANWSYDVVGRVTLSEHAGNVEKVNLEYRTADTVRVTGALGDRRTYTFAVEKGMRKVSLITGDECRTCGNGFMNNRSYDNNGYLNGYSDWQGNQTAIINNSRGLPIQQNDAVGTPEARTTYTTWHSSLNLPLSITEPKRQTTFTYTATGQLLTQTVNDPLSGSRTTTYTYHPLGSNGGGLIATVDGPRTDVNDVTSYEYNSSDDLISITNALSHVTQITSHDASGRPLTITDANSTAIVLTWDLRGRLTQSTFDNRATDYTYDPVGQLTRVTQADGSYLDYKYDDAHRLYEISDNLGHKITYTLDKMGNRTQTTTSDNSDTIALSQTAVFDKLSRLKQVLGSNGQSQTYNYDDNHNPLNSTDVQSRQSQSNYDALDRLIKSIDPDTKETDLEYDDQDNLTKVTDARGLETTYTYNGFDEMITQTSPDTGTTSYTYDSAGNVSSMTDARGITVNYTYDALNRILTESYPDSTELVRYRYDNGTRRKGRIYDIRDDSGRNIFSYDKRGNNTYRRNDIDGYQFITRYSYWNDNRLRVLTYPSGRQVLYTRDASGRVNRVRTRHKENGSYTPWSYLANNVTHQPFGDINQMTYGNGLSYDADFDLDARLTQQTIGSVINNIYSYTNVDNLLTIEDVLDNAFNQYFEHDNLDRLEYEEGNFGSRYFEFDEVGNRTYELRDTGSSITSSYKANANQLDKLNTQTNYIYDAVGNTVTDRNGVRTFTYNDKGRLETLSYNGVLRSRFKYNAQGQRVKKERTLTDGRILDYYFQYNKQGQLLSEVYYLGTRLISYIEVVWLEGRPITQIRTLYKSNGDVNRRETRYLHTDHLNTPRKATDENGAIVWRWDSDGFGYVQPNRDPDGDGTKNYIRLRFAGQYHDAESGLFYNYFRYYDPYTGRYVTSDPIGLAGGINTYGYVGGNPTNLTDPDGLMPRGNARGRGSSPYNGATFGNPYGSPVLRQITPNYPNTVPAWLRGITPLPEFMSPVRPRRPISIGSTPSFGQCTSPSISQQFRDLANLAIAQTKTNANPTVMRNGRDLFRVHKPGRHNNRLTQMILNGPPGNKTIQGTRDVRPRSSHVKKLFKAINKQDGYRLRLRNGKVVD